MRYILSVFLFFAGFLFLRAQSHPGKVTLHNGQVLEGEVTPIGNLPWFAGVVFTDKAGKDTQYLPGDIQSFFVNEDYSFPATYESIRMEDAKTYFFQQQFSDGALTYLVSPLPLQEGQPQQFIEIYKVNDQIVKVEHDTGEISWLEPKRDSLIKGGVITEKGDTLKGDYRLEKSKITLYDAAGKVRLVTDINKINGFYNNQSTYYNVNVAAPGERAVKELCWVITDGPVIQLLARQVDLTTYQQVNNTYYDNWGRLRRYPTARKVRSGFTLMYTIRHQKDGKTLNFLPDYHQPPTRLGNLTLLREWLKDYPALQGAALGNSINSEKALVNLYNLWLDINERMKN
jgi:hypothetical protein